MADTTPHDAHEQADRLGRPDQVPGRPLETPHALSLDTDVAERRCWRCLHMFPGDSAQAPTPAPEWWLCDPCDRILLPAKQRAA